MIIFLVLSVNVFDGEKLLISLSLPSVCIFTLSWMKVMKEYDLN